ncbi:General transcription factor 3C polypeptide 5 [Cucumispora dikerogammari]|nr:General transcription factor 3C polypeptide 5 [Cucumispora dikerogammari]
MKKFNLIKHPLKLTTPPQIIEMEKAYEVKYIENLTFHENLSQNFLHIEIPTFLLEKMAGHPPENAGFLKTQGALNNTQEPSIEDSSEHLIKIIGYGINIFKLKHPLSFQTFDNQSHQFTEYLHNFYTDDSLSNLATLLSTRKAPLFEHYLPRAGNKKGTFKKYDFTNLQAENTSLKYNVYYKFSDEIPKGVSPEYLTSLKNEHIENFNDYFSFVKDAFKKNKILSSSKLLKGEIPSSLRKHIVKRFLPLVAYYVITGPWKKHWIAFGFDPKTDIKMYKFQRIPIRKLGNSSQLMDFPELVREIEKSPLKYLKEECEYEKGFIKQEGIELIKGFLNEDIIARTTFDKASESEASDFDILL